MRKLMFLLILTVLSITVSYIAQAEDIVTDGLVSYWSFDRDSRNGNTVQDVWGENDATIVGNPKFQSGVVNHGIKLDGKRDFLNLTNLGDFGSHLATSTFEAWVKTDNNDDWTTVFKVIDPIRLDCHIVWGMDINRTIKRIDPANRGNPIERKNIDEWTAHPFDEGTVLIYFGHKIGNNGCSGFIGGFPYQVSDGEWHHLVYVMGAPYKDENGEMWYETAMVFDGVWQWKTRSRTLEDDDMIPFNEPVYLGAGNSAGDAEGHFKGMIDEVRIYNRPLTQAEALQNYEAGNPLSVESVHKLPTVWGALKSRP